MFAAYVFAVASLVTIPASYSGPHTHAPAHAQQCETYRITGYTAMDFPGITADGSTTTVAALNRGERIVAASYNLPFDTYVYIEGLGVYRVADRGHLGARHLDVLVWSLSEAYALTSYRTACVVGTAPVFAPE